jgi:hypothetical protein
MSNPAKRQEGALSRAILADEQRDWTNRRILWFVETANPFEL